MATRQTFTTVDDYLVSLPAAARRHVLQVRQLVRRLVPEGEERISYGMPAMFFHGVVVYYAAFKNHLGLYPPVRDDAVRKQVSAFAGPKGNLQFPLSQPLPIALIESVVRARLAESSAKVRAKKVRPVKGATPVRPKSAA